MNIYLSSWVFDILTLGLCALLLYKRGVIRDPLHPAAVFFGGHMIVVTFRVTQLLLGWKLAPWLVWRVTPEEIIRAAFAADLSLISMTLVWFFAAGKQPVSMSSAKARAEGVAPVKSAMSRRAAYLMATICLMSGLAAVAAGVSDTGVSHDHRESLADTAYVLYTTRWPIWAMCVFAYVRGKMTLPIIVGTVVSLGLSLNTGNRFGVILPCAFLVLIVVSRSPERRFRRWMVVAAAVLWLVWFPLKVIETDVALEGISGLGTALSDAGRFMEGEFTKEAAGSSGGVDMQYLDVIAAYMTLADLHADPFYGSTVLPLFVLPVPRNWWQEKPHIDDYLRTISTNDRPLAKMQMVPGLVGEGYANLWLPGVCILAGLVALLYHKIYRWAMGRPHLSGGRMFYLLLLVSAIQVYRDGMYSMILFPFAIGMPILLAAMAGYLDYRYLLNAGRFARTQMAARRRQYAPFAAGGLVTRRP